MRDKKKIIIIQDKHFLNSTGGVEKVVTFLANMLNKNGYQVKIATCEDIIGKPIFPLDERVVVDNIYDKDYLKSVELEKIPILTDKSILKWIKHKINKNLIIIKNKKILKKYPLEKFSNYTTLRSKLWGSYLKKEKPDLIINMFMDSLQEIEIENQNIPIISSINIKPDYEYTNIGWGDNKEFADLILYGYEKSKGVQVLLDSYVNDLPENFKGICKVIGNPVNQYDIHELVDLSKEKTKYTIINLARLQVNHKGQDKAIKVFNKLYMKYPNWELEFWGVGPDEDYLKELVKKLNIEDKVHFKGFTNDIESIIRKSDIFLFPSNFEGLPLALIEAMSMGLPSVGFTSCCGVNEVIENNVNGFLCDSDKDMVYKLEKLMQNRELRVKFGKEAHLSMKKYDPKIIEKKWLDFVNEFI